MRPRYLYLLLFLFLVHSLTAQNLQGLYVDNFKAIIGNPEEEEKLLQYAQNNGFNYLLLYNLYHIDRHLFRLDDPNSARPLAQFIEKAKTKYGVVEVGAVGEKFTSFDKLTSYQQQHAAYPNQQFDVFNIEFEFWNNRLVTDYYCTTYLEKDNLPCDRIGAFLYYEKQIKQLDNLTNMLNIKSETYIGFPSAAESRIIGETLDRVLVHFYRRSATYNNGNSIYNYHAHRIKDLAPKGKILSILPIFSARTNHMESWLANNPKELAFDNWLHGQKGYLEAEGSWKEHIQVEGAQWYRYTNLAQAITYQEKPIFTPKTELIRAISTIKAFPNPANEQLNIRLKTAIPTTIHLYNLAGKRLLNQSFAESTQLTLDVSAVPNGLYLLNIQNEDGIINKTVIIEHAD